MEWASLLLVRHIRAVSDTKLEPTCCDQASFAVSEAKVNWDWRPIG